MAAQFGRRLRKGAVATTVAAAAVAALSASQAPGVTGAETDGRAATADSLPAPEADPADSATGNSRYYTDLPPLTSPDPDESPDGSGGPGGEGAGPTGEAGIPATVLDAYKKAAARLNEDKPGCHLPWELLAAIGKVESGHARGGRVTADGDTVGRILGPRLDGNGFARISDTDGGAHDGDTAYDRAVGPMQFIPSTWAWAGRDGNGDGEKDPNNVYDAALAAAHYLCRFGWDLSDRADLRRAILSYNHSEDYLRTVLSWLEYYRKGTHEIPDGTGTLPRHPSDAGARPSPDPRPATPAKPSSPSSPSSPSTPSSPSSPAQPGKPGGSTPNPAPTQPPAGDEPSPAPTPTDTVRRLTDAGTGELVAEAGETFAERIGVRAETAEGKAVAKVRVRFSIIGETDAVFAGGENVATVVTDGTGTAVAPELKAGEKAGWFTVRATLVGRSVGAVDFTATVTERTVDALTRVGEGKLVCEPGGTFAERVRIAATKGGAAADRVAVTATLLAASDDTDDAEPLTEGPYFKGEDDQPVRTLTLRTDAEGRLTLPELHADGTAGAFLLRLTAPGGATLTLELTVTAEGSAEPEPSDPPRQ